MGGKIKKIIDTSFEERSFDSSLSVKLGESVTKMLPKVTINQ
jgi:hypothetical protein